MSGETKTYEFTEEELAPTEDEYIRMMGRVAYEIMNLTQMGVPPNQAELIARMRHDVRARMEVYPMDVNGVRTTCIAVEVGEERAGIVAIMHNGHTVITLDGTNVFNDLTPKSEDAKKKMN